MKIHEQIIKIMGEVGAIEKGRKNAQQGYSFRGIDDAYAAFQPLFARHGVFVVPTVLKMTREERQTKSGGALIYTTLEVKHTFLADDGSSIDAVTIGEAMDSGDKSSNKAMSAAMKYALLEVFCVPTQEDNDTENHSHTPAPRPPERRDYSAPAKPTPAPAKSADAKAEAAAGLASADSVIISGFVASYEPVKFKSGKQGCKLTLDGVHAGEVFFAHGLLRMVSGDEASAPKPGDSIELEYTTQTNAEGKVFKWVKSWKGVSF